MAQLSLEVEKRPETGKHIATLRHEGFIPGVIYGQKKESVHIKIPYNTFEKVYEEAGENTIVTVKGAEEGTTPVLIYSVTYNPVTDRIDHVDMYRIDMKKKIRTTVPLKFIGVAPAVKDLGGIMVTNKEHVSIQCLPGDLIHEIPVDISSLENFHQGIRIKDLQIPSTIHLLEDIEGMVVMIAPPKIEKELAAAAEAAAAQAAAAVPVEGAAAPVEGAAPLPEGEAKEAAPAEKKTEKK